MKAIELISRTDKEGQLRLDYQLDKSDSNVRVLILLEDELTIEERSWLKGVSANPAFDFLNNEEEGIYSINDGKPLDNKK